MVQYICMANRILLQTRTCLYNLLQAVNLLQATLYRKEIEMEVSCTQSANSWYIIKQEPAHAARVCILTENRVSEN